MMDLKWVILNDVAFDDAQALSQQLHVPAVIAQILLRRGISDAQKARTFFRASLDQLYDPFVMQDMTKAVERLRRAVLSDEAILIYGDYDVDGITSVSFLYHLFRELGITVNYYIPDRKLEGYGLSEGGIRQAHERGVKLIITTDCGVTAHAEIDLANSLGIDVIVSDHHEPSTTLPNALAVIDPKRPDCPYPFKQLAGVGVAFKLAQGLLLRLGIDTSILEKFIELVAIGTAADIVPLVEENRIFVKVGLERLNDTENVGLKALLSAAALRTKEFNTGQIVFIIAPRINAVGRMGDAERAVKLLTTDDPDDAQRIAAVLEQENRNRKDVDEQTFQEAIAMIAKNYDSSRPRSLVLHQEGWHTGVIGIVASRVVEKFYRPAVLISVDDGVGRGSARSIEGFDLYQALKKCEDLLLGYGGHKYAAGLSIAAENIPNFTNRFEAIAAELLSEDLLSPKLLIDAEISLHQVDDVFLKILKLFAPFGPQNMRPVFVGRKLQVVGTPGIVGRNHLRFRVRQDDRVFDVIGFNMGEKYDRLAFDHRPIDLAFVIDENEYMGRRTLQLRAKDLR